MAWSPWNQSDQPRQSHHGRVRSHCAAAVWPTMSPSGTPPLRAAAHHAAPTVAATAFPADTQTAARPATRSATDFSMSYRVPRRHPNRSKTPPLSTGLAGTRPGVVRTRRAGVGGPGRCPSPRPWPGTGPAATSGARRAPAPTHLRSSRRRLRAARSPSGAPARSPDAGCSPTPARCRRGSGPARTGASPSAPPAPSAPRARERPADPARSRSTPRRPGPRSATRACCTSLQGRPNAGRSTSSTPRSPSEHSRPPQAPQPGRGARRRTRTRSGSPAPSSTPSTSTSPSPNISSHARRGCLPQGSSRCSAAWRRRIWGIPRVQPRMVSALLRPQTRSAGLSEDLVGCIMDEPPSTVLRGSREPRRASPRIL